jgi:hypothetical protein
VNYFARKICRIKNSADTPNEIIHRVYNLTHRFESLLSYGTMRHFYVGERRGGGSLTANGDDVIERRARFLPTKMTIGRCRRRRAQLRAFKPEEISRVFNLLVTGNRPATSVPRARWASEERHRTGRGEGRPSLFSHTLALAFL